MDVPGYLLHVLEGDDVLYSGIMARRGGPAGIVALRRSSSAREGDRGGHEGMEVVVVCSIGGVLRTAARSERPADNSR